MSHKEEKCTCFRCSLIEKGFSEEEAETLIEQENQLFLDKYGFYVHIILEEDIANYHTHGLTTNKGHMDFQIVLPIMPEVAHQIFWTFVTKINEGYVFKANTTVDNIIMSFPVKLIEAVENDRLLLRIILPDENGKFPNDIGCNPDCAEQEKVNTSSVGYLN